MNTDLFNLPETLSPRLEWMKRHGITTRKHSETRWFASKDIDCAQTFRMEDKTEDEAITNLAKLLKIKLWNEEGVK